MLLILTGIALLIGMAIIGQAWALSSAVTNLWLGQDLIEQCNWLALFLICFIGVQLVVTLQNSLLDAYAFKQAHALRQQLTNTVFTIGPELVQAHGTGHTTTLLVEGIDQIETYLGVILQKMVRVLVIPLVLLIPVFILDWISGVILLIILPFIILYMVILGRAAQEKAVVQHRQFKMLSNHFVNSLRGLDTLKLFGVSKQHGKNIFAVSEQFRKATIKTLRVAILSGSVLDLFATLSVAAVAIMLGLRLLDGSLVLFPALTILILAPEYFKPLREFASDFHASLDGRNALGSIQQLLATYQQPAGVGEPEHKEVEPGESSGTDLSSLRWSANACLSLEDLCFSYKDFEALRQLTFEACGYAKIGIVGASGAGKSTLMHLLGGFASPSSGHISINGVETPSLRSADWQKQIAYLPQQPFIFHATLRDNLCFYHPEASAADIAAAVKAVGLESLVSELPEGLDTKVGEGERSLSGGQAQRVALARVWLDTSRSVLLFDEPTAHLDIETELELKQKMLPLMQNRLVFFATHRLHWMHEMDLILVLKDGMLVESGTLDELCAQRGHFVSLVLAEEGDAA